MDVDTNMLMMLMGEHGAKMMMVHIATQVYQQYIMVNKKGAGAVLQ